MPEHAEGRACRPGWMRLRLRARTQFAFNSAELTAQDKAETRPNCPVLKNPKLAFIAGEINGHTDNIGDEAYNLGLSKRRAQAVADYLKSKGVVLGDRFVMNGFGETKPMASNNTEEGRAQNRRVRVAPHRLRSGLLIDV